MQQAFDVLGAVGCLEWPDGIDALGRQTKRSAARHEQLDVSRSCRNVGNRWCGCEHVLEVVEHEQQLAAQQIPAEILYKSFATHREDAESPGCGGQDEIVVLQRREADEHDAVGEIVEKSRSDL